MPRWPRYSTSGPSRGVDHVAHVVGVADRPGEAKPHPGGPGDVDREVGCLLRHQAPGPGERAAAGPRPPPAHVDAVGHHLGVGHVPPGGPRVLAHRHVARPPVVGDLDGRLEPGGRWGVQRGDHRRPAGGRHGDRQVVQAVVVDDVDVTALLQLEHHLQVGMVLAQPHGRRHRDVRPRRRAEVQGKGGELTHAEARVAPPAGEHRDLDAAVAKAPAQVPRQGLQASGERLLEREARGRDHHDVHVARPVRTRA